MPLFISILLLFSALFTVYAIGVLIDALVGTRLSERVKVTGHRFIPAHLQHMGKTFIRVPDQWTLTVENSNGQGVVFVPQQMYEDIADGDIIQVRGKRGCLSKKWYLKKAEKDESPFKF